MAGISSPGLGSGIDVRGLVNQLIAAESAPKSIKLDRREANLQAELSAIGSLKSALASFRSSLSALNDAKNFIGKVSASSSNMDLFSASAAASAIPASYQVEVKALAQSHKLSSAAFTATDTAIGTGTLTFQYGDPTKPAESVTIDSADDSLEGIMRAVNDANIGVNASIVNGDSGYQLVFSATGTGTDNSIKISVTEDPANGTNTDTAGLSQFAYDPAAAVGNGKNLTELASASDASVVIDGITVTRSGNTISDAIKGVTLSLKAAEVGTKSTLSVSEGKPAVASTVSDFVDAYNKMVVTFKELGGYDPNTQTGGPLLGDSMLRTTQMQIRSVLGSMVAGSLQRYRTLADVGITSSSSDGTLKLDKGKLDSAISDDLVAVSRLFGAAGEASDPLINFESATVSTREGIYDITVSAIATQASYSDAASALSSLVVDATNDSFTIRVDGVTSGTITLGRATYADGDALAAELQSRINGDDTLKTAKASVVVEYDAINNRFNFISDK
ncbi:MAG: flagellar filament capping protein FliD, partial [Chromatiales bacterium]|nr:flagellar filament capping protein FliD [Chromatiales bacterium]